ncbi:ABC transporter substrate-binding protein [Haloarcula sediminis]|uniref:ABC transporter substrate-binding protein n=1 Tax=Haloarcula sediminis TaxID=3111777 RepID=UPI002D76C5E2|nr:extracellular solute-binding protein [Haloarcula sp. CK38]
MTDRITDRISRRSALKSLAVSGTVGLAGCGGLSSDSEAEYGATDIPPEEAGIEEWGQKLNDHAREAGIDWQQFEGEGIELTFGNALHPYATTTKQVKSYFEELTGITVNYETVSEEQYWRTARQRLGEGGRYDGIMCGLWPAGGYHYGSDGTPWVRDLWQFIEDDSLTDRDWLAMDDFREQTIELMTFPNEDGTSDFIGFPNGIEAYGCTAIHKPTFETLGLAEPTNFAELEDCARTISESDEVDREGIVSRTSSGTLSAANWGTMFKTYGADWIDRQTKEAALNSEQGINSLERFGGMLHNYGPENPSSYDWYKNNNAYSEGDVGMMYSTPQTSGIVDTGVMEETKWLPPLQGPDGRDPVVDTWVWATAITADSDHPEAAWLFIQWANSRQANLMLSTRQWQGDQPRAGYARFDWVDQQVQNGNAPPVPGEGYMTAFREGMDNVPGGRPSEPDVYPPVPVDTNQNMNIMSEAASAMSNVVANGPSTAAAELNNVAPTITEHAKNIPDRYVAADRFDNK